MNKLGTPILFLVTAGLFAVTGVLFSLHETPPESFVIPSSTHQPFITPTDHPTPEVPTPSDAPHPNRTKQSSTRSRHFTPSSNVLDLIGESGDGQNSTRRRALARLGANLSLADQRTLIDFLRDPVQPDMLNHMAYHAIKNDIMNLLRRQEPFPGDLPNMLASMYTNTEQTVLIRNYALQHLSFCYNKSSKKELITKTLISASQTHTNHLAGTALLGLHRIIQRNPACITEQQILIRQSILIAKEPRYDISARSAALQICAENHDTTVLPDARILAADSTSTFLQRTAIATLGDLGDASDLDLLTDLQNQNNPDLQTAISKAKDKIIQRTDGV
ncbi:MAG: HEAT repeat domain-containing protein [Kiritimatiellae bacterium]|nr:HEAT repeat domain-containing protein [Kiritimatiellia bacterium]